MLRLWLKFSLRLKIRLKLRLRFSLRLWLKLRLIQCLTSSHGVAFFVKNVLP